MFAGGLVLSATLIFFACWLQWTEHKGWPHDQFDGEEDRDYLTRRMKSRRFVNVLIGLCGVLILTATFAGVGLVFAIAWTLVTLILFVIVLLAGVDAYRTVRHQKDKLRRLRDQTLNE